MFERCLICTEFSDNLDRLSHFIPSLALGGFSHIVFYHGVSVWKEGEIPEPDSKQVQVAKERLQAATNDIPKGVKVNIEVSKAEPLTMIPKLIETYNIDLVILGTAVHNEWLEKIFGSTSQGLAKLTDKPLMIIRPQLLSVYTQEELDLRCQHLVRSLLVPYNDNDSSHYLLNQIKTFAQNQKGNSFKQILLVSVIEETREAVVAENRARIAQEKLQAIKADLEQLSLQVETQVRIGQPIREILTAATNSSVSAIALATTYQGNWLDWTVPDYTKEILRSCWFPLLFFSPKK